MDIKARLGQRLKELRTRAGLSQNELAYEARLDRGFLGLVERGERGIGIEALDRLAAALDTPLSQLLTFGSGRKNPSETPVTRLGRRVVALAANASEADLERFEVIAEAFFVGRKPRRGPRRRRRPTTS